MNTLLKRQLRKFVSDDLLNHPEMETFIDCVNRSYNNFDEQLTMLHRAMKISSDELSEANKQLREEAIRQDENINQLKSVINLFIEDDKLEYDGGEDESDERIKNLIDLMSSETKGIVEISNQREKLLKELAHQNNELSEYAHMVSHDLRSPLRSIDALSSWLSEDYADLINEEGKDILDKIRINVEKMDSLISGILDYSTVGKEEQAFYEVNLDLLLAETLKLITLPDNFKLKLGKKLPVVQGDKHRLLQLFQNLITNSIKYSDKPIIEVSIDWTIIGDYYKFVIEDNGKGISEEYQDKIFKTFFKLENTHNSVGIGLAIVKKIVESYGGRVWVDSELGEYTKFIFTLKKMQKRVVSELSTV